jgi:hypothetical protein
MYLPFVPVFLTSQLIIAVVDGVPTIDIQGTCRAAAAVTQGTSTQTDIDICVSSEQKARDQLVKDWAQYAAADKSRCVQAGPKVYLPSYIEWLTCLEMETAVKKMRLEQKTPPATPTPTQRQR